MPNHRRLGNGSLVLLLGLVHDAKLLRISACWEDGLAGETCYKTYPKHSKISVRAVLQSWRVSVAMLTMSSAMISGAGRCRIPEMGLNKSAEKKQNKCDEESEPPRLCKKKAKTMKKQNQCNEKCDKKIQSKRLTTQTYFKTNNKCKSRRNQAQSMRLAVFCCLLAFLVDINSDSCWLLFCGFFGRLDVVFRPVFFRCVSRGQSTGAPGAFLITLSALCFCLSLFLQRPESSDHKSGRNPATFFVSAGHFARRSDCVLSRHVSGSRNACRIHFQFACVSLQRRKSIEKADAGLRFPLIWTTP